tara:strand:- start:3417 stop:3662 length:246 start_codon:yes stop_codon:yes gene_type:complete
MSTQELLEDSLRNPAIGVTSSFQWHVTPVGIAALSKAKDPCLSEKFYADAVKEGLEVGVDLSREERESHFSQKGLVILFYS